MVLRKIVVNTGECFVFISDKKEKDSISLPKGKYQITLKLKKSWNGPNFNKNFIELKKDSYLKISDICPIDSEKLYKKGCSLSTGGDGTFDLYIDIKKVKKIGQDPYKKLLEEAKIFFKKNKYNKKTSLKFHDKFLSKCFYKKISKILEKERYKSLKKLVKNAKALLKNTNLKS